MASGVQATPIRSERRSAVLQSRVADIVAWPGPGETLCVECKRPPSGRQSEAQKALERFVTGTGRRPVPQDRKVRVTIQTYRKRQADRDKEHTAWKPCIDALRLLGWIRDDSPKWSYEDTKDPLVDKTPRSEIVIEEVSLEI